MHTPDCPGHNFGFSGCAIIVLGILCHKTCLHLQDTLNGRCCVLEFLSFSVPVILK